MNEHPTRPLGPWHRYDGDEMLARAAAFHAEMHRRRTVRHFSDETVPDGVIERCLLTAGTAPSGAHRQPWHFAVIRSAELKRRVREAAEAEEREFYERRASAEWLRALEPLGTDAEKPFLERAPCLIAVFSQRFWLAEDGSREKNYYAVESVGLATGLLITALHRVGLASLTHTPSPMGFLNEILGRPDTERPFLLLVVGYPEADARVPDITRKSLEDIASFH